MFLPPYDIPGAVYDVVYQQRPNGPLIPAGTVPTDSRDPIPFTISGLQPGTPYQLFLTARVGPRRSDRSRPLDTRTTDDSKLNGICCMHGAWLGETRGLIPWYENIWCTDFFRVEHFACLPRVMWRFVEQSPCL